MKNATAIQTISGLVLIDKGPAPLHATQRWAIYNN